MGGELGTTVICEGFRDSDMDNPVLEEGMCHDEGGRVGQRYSFRTAGIPVDACQDGHIALRRRERTDKV